MKHELSESKTASEKVTKELESSLLATQTENETMKKEKTEIQSKFDELKHELSESKTASEKLNHLEMTISDLRTELAIARKGIEKEERNNNTEIVKLNSELELKEACHLVEKKELTNKIDEINSKFENSVKSLRDVTMKESRLIEENASLKEEVQKLRAVEEDLKLKSEEHNAIIKMEFLRQAFYAFMQTEDAQDRQSHSHAISSILDFSQENQQMVTEQVDKMNAAMNSNGGFSSFFDVICSSSSSATLNGSDLCSDDLS